MNVDAPRVIAKLETELAAMTRRAIFAEAAVEQMQDTAQQGDTETEEAR